MDGQTTIGELEAFAAMAAQVRESSAAVARLEQSVSRLIEHESRGTVQTVIHRTGDYGGLLIGAIVACFATWVGVLFLAITMNAKFSTQNNKLRDLDAWRGVQGNQITALAEWRKQQESKK